MNKTRLRSFLFTTRRHPGCTSISTKFATRFVELPDQVFAVRQKLSPQRQEISGTQISQGSPTQPISKKPIGRECS